MKAWGCWLLCWCMGAGWVAAQPNRQRLVLDGMPKSKLARQWQRQWQPAPDSATAHRQLMALIVAGLHTQGYAEAALHSLNYTDKQVTAQLKPGPQYVWDSLTLRGLPPALRNELGLERWPQTGLPYSWASTQVRLQGILRQQEQVGHPFASLTAPEIQYRRTSDGKVAVSVILGFVAGPQVVIDSLVLAGRVRESAAFVGQLVRIRPGMLYNQQAIGRVPGILNNSIYYQQAQPPRLRLYGNRAVVEVPVQAKRNNRFDLLLGFLPPVQAGQAWSFTGLLDLQLVSALRAGEVVNLKYEQLPLGGRKLDLRYSHPYLFGSPLRAELRFDLLQQDTLWQTRTFEPSLAYAFTPQLSVKVHYRSRSSNIISTTPYRRLKWPPPPVLDGRSVSWGLGLEFDNLDYRTNPTRGISIQTDVGLGEKTIQRTRGLDSLEYSRLLSNQQRTELRLQLQLYRRLWARQVAMLGLKGYWLGMNEYFENDLALVGGARSLRGFNENQFLASAYAVATVEYRLLLEQNAYLAGFIDYAWVQRRGLVFTTNEGLVGTGISIQLQTAAGLFNISYAMGQGAGQSLNPIQGRIHLGYVATF